jgi:large subunit ribosomal protein L23
VCYTFEVAPSANRTSIADAVEATFNVKVNKVNTVIRKPKVKRARMRKMSTGAVGGMKKALVFLKKGYHINVE